MNLRWLPSPRRWETWFWTLCALAAAYLIYLLIAGLLTPAVPSTPLDNEMLMRGILSRGQHGESGWRFVATSSEISPDGYTTTYRDVRDGRFWRDGRVLYRLTAGSVTVDARNLNYSATQGVHVWSTSPTLPEDLRTENAYWDQSGQTLTCTTSTRFLYHGTAVVTSHMTVNLDTGASELGDTAVDYRHAPEPTAASTASPTPP